jgi:hypothetical protein
VSKAVSEAIDRNFTSPNVADSNFESANVVDVLQHVANASGMISRAITAPASAGSDHCGGHVECLTEAVMGITSGLCKIADSIDRLAEAIENKTG